MTAASYTGGKADDGSTSPFVTPKELTGHLPGLDGIRGFAVLLVMAAHFVGGAPAVSEWQKIVVTAATHGWMGVDLFFVLSGFLITGLLIDSKGTPHYLRNFYARRTLRIFPLYYLVLVCLFLILPEVTTPSPLLESARANQIWLWTYTSNFYIATTSSWSSLNYVSHFWSLAIEEQFYLFWPLVVLFFSRVALERICLGVLVFALGLRIALTLAGISELSISVLTPCRIDTLCLGAFVALRVRRPGGFSEWVGRAGHAALIFGVAWFAVVVIGWLIPFASLVLHQLRNSLDAFFFAALLLVALKPPSNVVARILQGRVLRFFGKYSYGLYVYHGILTWYLYEAAVDEKLDALLGNPTLSMVARVIIGVGVSILISVLSYNLFERRFLALKRHFNDAPSSGALDGKGSASAIRVEGTSAFLPRSH